MAVTKIWTLYNSVSDAVNYIKDKKKTTVVDITALEQKIAPGTGEDTEELIVSDISAALDYISQDKKTHARQYVTGLNCDADTAYDDMQKTKNRFGKTSGAVGYHCVQSFKPGEIDPDMAHSIGIETANELWGQFGYEVLVSTHIDRAHVHNHFVINSVNSETGEKDPIRYHRKISQVSDEIVREHSLSIIENPGLHPSEIKRLSRRQYDTKLVVDELIEEASDLTDFCKKMNDRGYDVQVSTNRAYWTVKHETWKRPIRFIRFGEEYSNSSILKRIIDTKAPDPELSPKERYTRIDSMERLENNWKGTYQYKYFLHLYKMGIDIRKLKHKQNYQIPDKEFELTLKRISYLTEHQITTLREIEDQEVVLSYKKDYLAAQRTELRNEIRRLRMNHSDFLDLQEQLDSINMSIDEIREELRILQDIKDNSDPAQLTKNKDNEIYI